MVAVDGSCHAWPWAFDRQNAADFIVMKLIARNRVPKAQFHAKERQRGTSRFHWRGTLQNPTIPMGIEQNVGSVMSTDSIAILPGLE